MVNGIKSKKNLFFIEAMLWLVNLHILRRSNSPGDSESPGELVIRNLFIT